MNKRRTLITILLLTTLLAGCKGSGSVPSESDGRKVFENRVRVIANENGMMRQLPEGIVRPISFKKTNGQLKDDGGVKRYRLDYEGVVEYLVDVPSSPFNSFRKRNKGDRVTISRSMNFEMTERGWLGEDGQIY
jgi:hypothetical protein